MASSIAVHYDLLNDAERERLACAALYHDMFREVADKKLKKYAEEMELVIIEEERKFPSLLHAPVAAFHAQEHSCLAYPDITSAIRWHTLSSPEMGLMGAILYCADYMELERSYMSRKKVASLLTETSLELLLKRILEDHFDHSEKKRRKAAQTTMDTYRYLCDGGEF